jgi:CRP/FNR family transcriptional regulator
VSLETVSRTLSAFQQQGCISVDKKHLRIIDFDGLTRMTDRCLQ